jgi:hypothetical protein
MDNEAQLPMEENDKNIRKDPYEPEPRKSWTLKPTILLKEKDPHAMNIDASSVEEQTKLMKDKKCFLCQKPGHMAKDYKKNNFSQNK